MTGITRDAWDDKICLGITRDEYGWLRWLEMTSDYHELNGWQGMTAMSSDDLDDYIWMTQDD